MDYLKELKDALTKAEIPFKEVEEEQLSDACLELNDTYHIQIAPYICRPYILNKAILDDNGKLKAIEAIGGDNVFFAHLTPDEVIETYKNIKQ